MVTKKLSAFIADSFFMYVLLLVGANSVRPHLFVHTNSLKIKTKSLRYRYAVFLQSRNFVAPLHLMFLSTESITQRATSGRLYMVCVLFLSENHKLADDIVKYQHHNVCHYLCYPIVEAEK